MKNNLLQEIQQILEREEVMQISLPIPTYLYVQRYGRSIEADMKEIAELLGKEKWFSFKASHTEKDGSILRKFLIEQECQASLGKEYNGCIFVELSGEEEEEELEEFLDYIEQQKQRLSCIFMTKAMGSMEDICKQLSTDCFVRVVKGDAYDPYEQIDMFVSTLESYQFQLDEEARKEITEFFRKKKWQENDAVEMQISNMAKSIVYEKFLNIEKQNTVVTKEEVQEAISELMEEPVRKRPIGFAREV